MRPRSLQASGSRFQWDGLSVFAAPRGDSAKQRFAGSGEPLGVVRLTGVWLLPLGRLGMVVRSGQTTGELLLGMGPETSHKRAGAEAGAARPVPPTDTAAGRGYQLGRDHDPGGASPDPGNRS